MGLKFFKNILSILLVSAFLNIVVTKGLHEFFEHQHEIHTCLNKDQTHFHEVEFSHFDLICNFNFSASLLDDVLSHFDNLILYKEHKVKIHLLWLAKDLCSNSISLRGPPISL